MIMTTTTEATTEGHVIRTHRKNKPGERVPVHYFRAPAKNFKRTLDGVDEASPAYQRSLIKAQDEYARFLAMGEPKAGGRNAKGSLIDDKGMVITKPPAGSLPIEETSLAWLVRKFLDSAQGRSLNPTTLRRAEILLQRVLALPWPAAGPCPNSFPTASAS